MYPTVQWLSQKFAEYNKQYFGGKIPTPQFSIERLTGEWGRFDVDVDYDRNRRITRAHSNGVLTVNGNYSREERSWINTLLHEMCHAYVYLVMGVLPRDPHGREFLSVANAINRYGWNIEAETNEDDTDVYDENGNQPILCVITNNANQYYRWWVCKVDENNIDQFRATINANPQVGVASFYKVNSQALNRIQSNPSTLDGWGGQTYAEAVQKMAAYCGCDYREFGGKNLTKI